MFHPSHPDQLTACVDKEALLIALKERVAAWRAEIEPLLIEYDKGLAAEIAKAPSVERFMRKPRPLTDDEIKARYDGHFGEGSVIAQKLYRNQDNARYYSDIHDVLDKSSVTDVRLTKDELLELKDYL